MSTAAAPESEPPSTPSAAHAHHGHAVQGSLAALALGALGVVYGDIGTSPLYALRECFSPASHISVTEANVLGLLSLFFWSMTLVVTIKYVLFITRADNEGEGGILALLALVIPKRGAAKTGALVLAGLFGAALLYADGMLTPAISVLSAVDLFPSFAKIAGAPPPPAPDGQDISPALFGRPLKRKKDLFWEYGRTEKGYPYPGLARDRSPNCAIRSGPWKLLQNADSSQLELYNLNDSPNEEKPANNPRVARELSNKLLAWRRALPENVQP